MKALQLNKIDFSNIENNNPLYTKLLGVFMEQNGLSAHGHVDNFLAGMEPVKHYLGYDNRVYPIFEIVEIDVNFQS